MIVIDFQIWLDVFSYIVITVFPIVLAVELVCKAVNSVVGAMTGKKEVEF